MLKKEKIIGEINLVPQNETKGAYSFGFGFALYILLGQGIHNISVFHSFAFILISSFLYFLSKPKLFFSSNGIIARIDSAVIYPFIQWDNVQSMSIIEGGQKILFIKLTKRFPVNNSFKSKVPEEHFEDIKRIIDTKVKLKLT